MKLFLKILIVNILAGVLFVILNAKGNYASYVLSLIIFSLFILPNTLLLSIIGLISKDFFLFKNSIFLVLEFVYLIVIYMLFSKLVPNNLKYSDIYYSDGAIQIYTYLSVILLMAIIQLIYSNSKNKSTK